MSFSATFSATWSIFRSSECLTGDHTNCESPSICGDPSADIVERHYNGDHSTCDGESNCHCGPHECPLGVPGVQIRVYPFQGGKKYVFQSTNEIIATAAAVRAMGLRQSTARSQGEMQNQPMDLSSSATRDLDEDDGGFATGDGTRRLWDVIERTQSSRHTQMPEEILQDRGCDVLPHINGEQLLSELHRVEGQFHLTSQSKHYLIF